MKTSTFHVHINQAVLDDMKSRIKATRWLDDDLKELANYWGQGFDWRKAETAMNAFPQFISEIDGYKIHYLHVKSKLSPGEKEAQQQLAQFFAAEGAYAQIQATKPQALAYGLNDSPIGLCAWLLEIFRIFSDPSKTLAELFAADMKAFVKLLTFRA